MSAALAAVVLLGAAPGQAAAAPDTLPALQAELSRTTARAVALADALDAAAARDSRLRVALDELAETQDLAQRQLDVRARLVFMRSRTSPLDGVARGLAGPHLRHLLHRGSAASLTVDRDLIEAVTAQAADVKALQARSSALQRSLRAQAAPVLAAQDRARVLLAQAEALAEQQRATQAQQVLAEQRAVLDDVSAAVTVALTPAQTRRSRAAATAQAPVVVAVEAAGPGYPVGYRPSGQVLQGVASWYGPGFVGRPTASGAPYDPERLTCAHKSLPLGTVIRVSANGAAVSCLVNDRGPYVGDRILDMSRAGSRALGYDGLATVVIEVLAPA